MWKGLNVIRVTPWYCPYVAAWFCETQSRARKHSEILMWRWAKYFVEVFAQYVNYIFKTVYGRPVKPSFIKIPNFWAWDLGQTIWADKFWAIWVSFSWFISTRFGTVSFLSMFSVHQLLFLRINKFEPQMIRDLAIVF